MDTENEKATEQDEAGSSDAKADVAPPSAGPGDARPASAPAGGEPYRERRPSSSEEPYRPRRRGRRRVCPMCEGHMDSVDYKDFSFLRRFVSDRGRIETRRKSGTCAKHQRTLAQAIKRARHLALLPYTADHVRISGVSRSRY